MSTVPRHVLAAFGVAGEPTRLAGGQGMSHRARGIVLKPVDNAAEAEWIAYTCDALVSAAFRVPRHLRSPGGAAVVDGWIAYPYLEGAVAGRNGGRWNDTLAVCRDFHAALARFPRPAFLDSRSDPWDEADRMAWGDAPVDAAPVFADAIERLLSLLRPVSPPFQVIHGDVTGNVLFAPGQPPAVIDFSPYWRPAGLASAVIVTDAITWGGAERSILGVVADIPEFPQLFARATLGRVLQLDRLHARGRPGMPELLPAWLPAIELAGELVASER